MGIRKPATVGCKPVDVGRLDFRRAIATKVAVAEIVGKDQNDVGWSFSGAAE
jgi:hypothetical protein